MRKYDVINKTGNTLRIALSWQQDWATATDNTYRKFREVGHAFLRHVSGDTNDRDTKIVILGSSRPSQGQSKYHSTHPLLSSCVARPYTFQYSLGYIDCQDLKTYTSNSILYQQTKTHCLNKLLSYVKQLHTSKQFRISKPTSSVWL